MLDEMSRAERDDVAQPHWEWRSVPSVQSVCMSDERTVAVRTLESSKWWVVRRRESDSGRGR